MQRPHQVASERGAWLTGIPAILKRREIKPGKDGILVIQNALFIHFDTDDFLNNWNKISYTHFEVFSSTCNKRIVEHLRIK